MGVAAAAIGDPVSVGIPTLLEISDPATGQVAAVPTGLPVGWIMFILFLMLLLVAIGLLAFLCIIKKKNKEKDDGFVPLKTEPVTPLTESGRYEPVREYDSDYGSQIGAYESPSVTKRASAMSKPVPKPPPKPPKADPGLLKCRIVHYVEKTDDSVLAVEEGDIVYVTPQDFDEGGDWVWVTSGKEEGYVPRSAVLCI